tara:strand:- start:513 stop:956 length:444 start_codon:yes stop_codon:yes gene_type:complete
MAIPDDTSVFGKITPKKSVNQNTLKEPYVKGFDYPLKSSPGNGYFSKSSGLGLIKNMLKSFLKTSRGERFMLMDYGANLQKFLMEPLDQSTFRLIKDEIEESIRKYFRRVQVNKIQVFETRDNNLLVKLFLSIKDSTSANFNLEVRI